MAASVPATSLFADPKLIHNPRELSRSLAKVLDIPSQALRKALVTRDRRFVWIKRQLTEKQRDEIKKWNQSGLGFIEEPKRVYPNGSVLSQVMGFVGSEGNGQEGLELQYNKDLEGKLKLVLLPRDARGRPLLQDGRALTEVPDGADLELTIDHEVQFTLERELASVMSRFEAASANGLVIDAQTSEILAMANLPLVDFNEGSRANAELHRNRIVTDAYEPGSTLKTFVIAGALHENLVKPSTRYNCEGGRMKVGDKWISEADAHHHFQSLNVTEILAYSSNIGAAKIAFDLGAERLNKILQDFGFGSKPSVGLPGEVRGIINPLPWRKHLLSNIAFGQGIAVTPLQMAMAYTAIANGGVLKKPLLVKAIHNHEKDMSTEFHAEEIRRVLTPSEAATLRLMLAAATEDNATGFNARIPGYPVAGKTGTAQKADLKHGGYQTNAYVSSFVGFVPASTPRYVILVSVDDPKKVYYGSQVAAPVFAKMAQYLVRRAGLPPVLISESNMIPPRTEQVRQNVQNQAMAEIRRLASDATADANIFPNILGLTLREAISRVHDLASGINVRGHGVVVRTLPVAGTPWTRKSQVTLVLENPD